MNKNKQIEITCIKCSAKVVRTSNNQKYCFKCSKFISYRKKLTKEEKTNVCEICDNLFVGRQKKQHCCHNPFCREEYYMIKYKKHYFSKKQIERFISKYAP